jgi:hypothetical protein
MTVGPTDVDRVSRFLREFRDVHVQWAEWINSGGGFDSAVVHDASEQEEIVNKYDDALRVLTCLADDRQRAIESMEAVVYFAWHDKSGDFMANDIAKPFLEALKARIEESV